MGDQNRIQRKSDSVQPIWVPKKFSQNKGPWYFFVKKNNELKIDVPKVPVDVTLETMQRDIDIGWRRHFFCCPVLTIIQDSCIVRSLLAPFPTIIPQIL